MADITSYPQATPNGDDLILGSQADEAGFHHTKTFTTQSIADLGSGGGGGGVTRITAGTNISINPTGGTGNVTINSTAVEGITASSTDTLTNKSGNISQWTNDSGYLSSLPSSVVTNSTDTYATDKVEYIVTLTQAQYDAATIDNNTLYIIVN